MTEVTLNTLTPAQPVQSSSGEYLDTDDPWPHRPVLGGIIITVSRVESQADTAERAISRAPMMMKHIKYFCYCVMWPSRPPGQLSRNRLKISSDQSSGLICLIITRWLWSDLSGLSRDCGDGGQWLDLATFPSPAEYKELGARRDERERERAGPGE